AGSEHVDRLRNPGKLEDFNRHEPTGMRALERRDSPDGTLQQSRKLSASPLDRLRGFVRRRTSDRLFSAILPDVAALAGLGLRRPVVGRRRLLSLGRRLVSVRAGLGLRRLLFGCRRLRSLTRGFGFALLVVATG